MKKLSVQLIAKTTFWLCLIAGNICLFGFIISRIEYFAFAGFCLLYIATLINVLVIIGLFIYGFVKKEEMKNCLKSISILLINIPIATLYTWIGLEIL